VSREGLLISENISLLATSDASTNVNSFWKQIKERVSSSREFQLREDERSIWLETWMAAADGAISHADILLKALLSLPDSAATTPPIRVIIQVVRRIIARIQTAPKVPSDVATLEGINDLVRRIKCNSEPIPEDCNLRISLSDLCANYKAAIEFLMRNGSGDVMRLATLLLHHQMTAMKDSVLKRMTKPRESESDNTISHMQPWNGWRENPSLGWLMNGSWHRDTDLRSFYSSPEEYASSLSKLWTLLTFYWGSGIADIYINVYIWLHLIYIQI
jgi:hypothetical protein